MISEDLIEPEILREAIRKEITLIKEAREIDTLRSLIKEYLLSEIKDEEEVIGALSSQEEEEEAAAAGEIEPGSAAGTLDYTPSGTAKKVNRKVKVNAKIRNAWEWLSPFLPDGSKMTSGGRTQADQNIIIRDYASSKLRMRVGNTSAELDVAHSALKKAGYIIARKIGSGHGSWQAMDISGAPLKQIKRAVITVSNDPDIPVTFSEFKRGITNRSILEPKNNAVHVGIVRADSPNPQKLAQVILKYTGTGTRVV